MPVETSKQSIDTVRYPTRLQEPFIALDDGLHRFGVKVLLDIYREEMRGIELFGMHDQGVGLRGSDRDFVAPLVRTSNAMVGACADPRPQCAISLRDNDKAHLATS